MPNEGETNGEKEQVSQILYDAVRRALEDHGYTHGFAVVKRTSRKSWAITTGVTRKEPDDEMVAAVESAFTGGGGDFGGGGASGKW